MQDLQDFVDVVQGVNSGRASLFGLRKRKCSRDQLKASSFTEKRGYRALIEKEVDEFYSCFVLSASLRSSKFQKAVYKANVAFLKKKT